MARKITIELVQRWRDLALATKQPTLPIGRQQFLEMCDGIESLLRKSDVVMQKLDEKTYVFHLPMPFPVVNGVDVSLDETKKQLEVRVNA